MTLETITVSASLVNAEDSTEVNVVAAVATVGNTLRLSTGQIIKWTPDFLRAKAHTFVGKPVNIMLDSRDKATDHSRRVIGAIKDAYYDEDKQAVMVTAALWEHYNPSTVKKIRDLYAKKELNVSMEMKYPKDTLIANSDGSYTPTEGTFSGMGFVNVPGDPRSMVYLMAALKADEDNVQETSVTDVIKEIVARLTGTHKEPVEERSQDEINNELSAAHEGSFEWIARAVQEHLSAGKNSDTPVYNYIIATYPNYAIYQEGTDYFRIDYKRSGDKLNFGEPQEVDPVYQPTAKASAEEGGVDPADNTGNPNQGERNTMTATPEELQAAKDKQIEELKASLDAASATLSEMKAALEARDKADAEKAAAEQAVARANERMGELEKIVPIKDELKAGLFDNLKVIDDAAYEALKSTFAASAELRAGIAPGEGISNPDPVPTKDSQKVPEAEMKKFQEEAKAQFGSGLKSEDKE